MTQRSVSGISAFGPFFERGWTTASFEGARGASLSCTGAAGVTLIGAAERRDVSGGRAAACGTGAGAGTALATVTVSTAVVL